MKPACGASLSTEMLDTGTSLVSGPQAIPLPDGKDNRCPKEQTTKNNEASYGNDMSVIFSSRVTENPRLGQQGSKDRGDDFSWNQP